MNAFNDASIYEPSYAAHVWQGEPPWTGVRPVWKKLTDRQNSPSAIYQSPSYFEYLAKVVGSRSLDLLTVKAPSTEGVVGVSPVQKLWLDIPFSIGNHTMFRARLPCLRILGSEPLIPKTPEAYDRLFALIAAQYPDLSVVEMEAVGVDSFLWQYLFSSQFIRDNYVAHVLHGVQACHFVHLPPSLEEYGRRLGRKHRHNLERQQRVLERYLNGPLTLTLLTREEQVPVIIEAMRALGEPGCDAAATKRRLMAAAQMGFYYCFILRSNDRTVGMTSGYRSNTTYRIQRILYDKELEKYSPGTTMWQIILRYLIEDATFNSVDMGYGTPAYSHRSINTIHKRGKVLLFRKTMTNRFLINAHTAFSAVAHLGKQALLPATPLKQRANTRN